MKKLVLLLVCLGLCGLAPALADVIYVSGDVSGTWSADSIIVTAEVRVPPQDTLVIEPGVKVLFFDYCKFIVDAGAVLRAVGTVNDTILFDEYWPGNHWKGIRFRSASDSCRLQYCHLKHGWTSGSGSAEDVNGGAIYCSFSSPTIRNCLIESCYAANGNGGGIYCYSSSPTIDSNAIIGSWCMFGGGINCSGNSNPMISNNTISGNAVWGYDYSSGGGINCDHSSPTISNNTITANSASHGAGGIYCWDNSNPTITGNTISGNTAGNSGGGISCVNSSSPVITGNTISGNSANGSGGGILCDWSSPIISSNAVTGNLAGWNGGGICCWENTNPTISGNTISRNSANNGGGGIFCNNSFPTIQNCVIDSCSAGGEGGGILSEDSDPTILGNTLRWNQSYGSGGGMRFTNSNALIQSNVIDSNTSINNHGGAICIGTYSNATLIGNRIRGNYAGGTGGAIVIWTSPTNMELNEISNNTASTFGGGIFLNSSNYTLNKNTVAFNHAGTGGGFLIESSTSMLVNCILWGNTAPASPMIHQTGGSNTQVAYSDLQDFWSDTTNIFDDPLFVDPVNRDYHLQIGSPCIDTGDPASPPDPDSTIADMGAYWRDRGYRPPSVFNLISPHWGDTCWTSSALLVWHAARDTNTNDTVTYEIWLDTLANLSTRWEVASGLHDTTYALGGLADNHTYYWWVHASDLNTLGRWAENVLMFRFHPSSAVSGEEILLPTEFALYQNYPNPFNPTTLIRYDVKQTGTVSLKVFDLLGREVVTLVHGPLLAGSHTVTWDASGLSSGIYICQMKAGDFVDAKKMVLIR